MKVLLKIFLSVLCVLIMISIISGSNTVNSHISDSNNFDDKIKYLITYDSTNIFIEKSGKVKYRYSVSDSNYLEAVYYDRITGLISFQICTPTRIEEKTNWIVEWKYALMVWDFRTNKLWNILNSKSSHSESYRQYRVCNFSPESKSCFFLSDGWESTSISKYNYETGTLTIFKALDVDYRNLLVNFNQDSILVSEASEGGDTCYFYIYNILTDQKKLIEYNQVLNYDHLILSQFGKNIHYRFRKDIESFKGVNYWNSDWNPEGNTCIYHKIELFSEKNNDYFWYDKPTDKSELIKTRQTGCNSSLALDCKSWNF